MGTKRVEGKRKIKSIKAKVTSKFSATRKLSRNGKKIKKGMMGPGTEFITRSSAIKKLQITLKDFRRLCILKGIYPRVPSKAPSGSDKVYYDIKDISFLSHEPLLAKFREFKSFMKKIRRAAGRNQYDEARRKDRLKPVISLDHLVRERYPRFIDALRDLDDALCMIFLFASLPSSGRITAERTTKCKELSLQWQYICMKSKTLRKVFVSVKGVYYQVEIMGEQITWIIPHPFTQVIPKEVDLRVMMTFLEFYEVFIQFVLFKLYYMEGLKYPPTIDKDLYDSGCSLLSIKTTSLDTSVTSTLPIDSDNPDRSVITDKEVKYIHNDSSGSAKDTNKFSSEIISSLNEKLKEIEENHQNDGEIGRENKPIRMPSSTDPDNDESEDEETTGILAGPLAQILSNLHDPNSASDEWSGEEEKVFHSTKTGSSRTRLFTQLRFFINREVQLDWMQFCIISFGGTVGWDGPFSPFTANDQAITHHIVDRPAASLSVLFPNREYVQPQWIFDSINLGMTAPVHRYRVGAILPPHLSPFVDDEEEGYVPKYKEEMLKYISSESDNRKEKKSEQEANQEQEEESENIEKNSFPDYDQYDEGKEHHLVMTSSTNPINFKKGPKAIVHAPKVKKITEVIHPLHHSNTSIEICSLKHIYNTKFI
jgi:pescadillo protein